MTNSVSIFGESQEAHGFDTEMARAIRVGCRLTHVCGLPCVEHTVVIAMTEVAEIV